MIYTPVAVWEQSDFAMIFRKSGNTPGQYYYVGVIQLEVSVKLKNTNNLSRFGFSFGRGGAHSSRTMMLDELRALLSHVGDPEASKADYLHAIDEENCLGKRSRKTRILTYRHLVDLYSLDSSMLLFRAMLYFWQRDPVAQPLLALLCTYARDAVFRSSATFILKVRPGNEIVREELESCLDALEPGRFSKATLKSTAQNINATWTKSGHLKGKRRKIRTQAEPTEGSISYALLLAYLTDARGNSLFRTEYIKLLDCSFEQAIELAEKSARKGWIVFKRVGDVMEVLFPNLINAQEMEWLREQG